MSDKDIYQTLTHTHPFPIITPAEMNSADKESQALFGHIEKTRCNGGSRRGWKFSLTY